MRIDQVKANNFGPLADKALHLGAGMNIVYGPNESGKSSWHAALFVALCGMRKSKGAPKADDRIFSARYRPWSGRLWRVSAMVTLDDGRSLRLEQCLSTPRSSAATDVTTGRKLTDELEWDGAVDGSRLLGLQREAVLATLFVRQSEMLRVLTDSGALQEFIERAAATVTVQTTADEALEAIRAYRGEHVGVVRVGSRGPLATATSVLAEASAALEDAQLRYDQYEELLVGRRAKEIALAAAQERLVALAAYEQRRHELDAWEEIRAAQNRLIQVRQLSKELIKSREVPDPDPAGAERVTEALTLYRATPDLPPKPTGPALDDLDTNIAALPAEPEGDQQPDKGIIDAREALTTASERLAALENEDTEPDAQLAATIAALEMELAALPDLPEGDLEPSRDVVGARDDWQRSVDQVVAHQPSPAGGRADGPTLKELEAQLAALPPTPSGDREPNQAVVGLLGEWQRASERAAAHAATMPNPGVPETDAEAVELRRLADELEVPVDPVDTSLRDRVEALRAAVAEADKTQQTAGISGTNDHQPDRAGSDGGRRKRPSLLARLCAAIAARINVLVAVLAFRKGRTRNAAPATVAAPTPATQVPNPHVDELRTLEAQLAIRQEVAAQGSARRRSAEQRLDALSLPVRAERLRALAAAADHFRAELERLATWERSQTEAEALSRTTEVRLRKELTQRGTASGDREPLEQVFARYCDDCRERSDQATEAAGRAKLHDLVEMQRAADRASEMAATAWAQRRAQLAAELADNEARLRSLLTEAGCSVSADEPLEVAYRHYLDACRERAQTAAHAARRPDVEARLNEQVAAREAQEELRAERERQHLDSEASRATAAAHLAVLLFEHGTPVEEGQELETAFWRYLAACRERSETATQAARRADLEAQRRATAEAEAAYGMQLAERQSIADNLMALAEELAGELPPPHTPDSAAEALTDWLAVNDERTAAARRRDECHARLEQALDGVTIDDLEDDIVARIAEAGDAPGEDEGPLADESESLAGQQRAVTAARDAVALMSGEVGAAKARLISISEAIETEARAEAEVARIHTLAADLDHIEASLCSARDKVHADLAPVLGAAMRPWVSTVTGGRYDDTRVDPSSLELEALEASTGRWRTATGLSHGTAEQLYLLLRLALAEQLATTDETAPFVLDDPTVQSDAERTEAMLDMLLEVSRTRQIVIFTQENEVLEWASTKLTEPHGRVIRLVAQ